MIRLLQKSITTIASEGPAGFADKAQAYVKRLVIEARERRARRNHYKDVLFVNGCTLPHPTRYRVDHQIEQLHFAGYSADFADWMSLDPEKVRFYRAFVFFRCPHTPQIEEFIARAKRFHKPVLFDIDDLVIDEEYVRTIKYLKTMSPAQLDEYMDGVNRLRRTLQLCDAAITTTGRLAAELAKFTPKVYVNRNVASEKMVALSNDALARARRRDHSQVVLGYFSGSITHNDDVRLILPALVRVLQKYPQARLKLVGHLDLPPELEPFRKQILFERFVNWHALPKLIASADINLAPLEVSIFNEAKSENKWVEAALVAVPTVASDHGAIAQVAKNGENVVLCKDDAEHWFTALSELIESPERRKALGRAARQEALEHFTTAHTFAGIRDIVAERTPKGVAFVLPSTQVSGGVNVVVRHAASVQRAGHDVCLLSMDEKEEKTEVSGVPVVPMHRTYLHAHFDRAVATLWSTLDIVRGYTKFSERYYLVQNFEPDFYKPPDFRRILASSTYGPFTNVHYVTISHWCQRWLKDPYRKDAAYIPNGIDIDAFAPKPRGWSDRIRVLVEGNSDDHYKNVDESFAITNQLDPQKFEVWYLSYKGLPKKHYRVDKFLHKVPYAEVAQVYQSCHVLLKSSRLESFSYPPLEMMSTGGVCVVASNPGNAEYLRDGENCLLYTLGDTPRALRLIENVSNDAALRERLVQGGLTTARSRDWRAIEGDIPTVYGL